MIWDWKVILIVSAVTSIVIVLTSGVIVLLTHRIREKSNWMVKRRYILRLLSYICGIAALTVLVIFVVIVSLYPDTASSTSAIAQVLAAGGVSIAAFAAVISILKTRPLAVRAVEKHSEALNFFLVWWLGMLDSIRLSPHALPVEAKNIDIINSIERKPLFCDLSNHLPSEITLLQDWQQFHDSVVEYEEARLQLWNRIRITLEQSTKLTCGQATSDKAGFLHPTQFVGPVYTDSIFLAENKPQIWLEKLTQDIEVKLHEDKPDIFWLLVGGSVLASTSTEAEARDAFDIFRSTINNLSKSDVEETDYVVKARSIFELKEKAVSLRGVVLNTLNELQLIAIFPGNCKYLGHTRK